MSADGVIEGRSTKTQHARRLFAGVAPQYGWMGAALSFGQDIRWRRALVSSVDALSGSVVLDVASGTGLVARELAGRGLRVVQLDPSEPMLRAGWRVTQQQRLGGSVAPVLGRAEELPFPDGSFDALTFTYLLRYVDDPASVMRELARVVRPGGAIASLEFHVPEAPLARAFWRFYTAKVMPGFGAVVSPSWAAAGRFLGPSIEGFYARHPLGQQLGWWFDARIDDVRARTMANGAAVVIAGRRA
jgi:demethylmenaquinone methyltransferase/2-methoxy-6-polyprenyl-1,4-benzoquinol methylase